MQVQPTQDGVRVRQKPVDGTVLGMVGSKDLLDVLEDSAGAQNKLGKADQWINVRSIAGLTGFVSAGFLKAVGGNIAAKPAAPAATASTAPTPTTTVLSPDQRTMHAAFAITAAFEGHGYSAYNNYDAGIISYGRFQFTMAAGGMANVLNKYLERSTSSTAQELRNYQPRVNAKEEALRGDARFKDLLVAAANEPEMRQVQDEAAMEGYWKPMLELSATPRGIQTPLGLALLFDMAINHGLRHAHLGKAEENLKVPPKSKVPDNGVTEQQLIAEVAKVRNEFMIRFAEKNNFPGLKVRGQFWVNLVNAGDWTLQGDANGNVNVNGRAVQMRTL